MYRIDGSRGEGGGQILRTSLAISMITGTPVRLTGIRARRSRPGLMRQHLTAVLAAAQVCAARVEGAGIGSREIAFTPAQVVPGEHHFAVGTAGSTTLILQTVLPALLLAAGPSRLTLEGGTHNPLAPPFEFLDRAFLPLLRRMGARVEATLERAGFYPAGSGRLAVAVEPSPSLQPLELNERGEIRRVDSPGPGNAVLLELESDALTEVFTAVGQVGIPAEAVAERAVREMRAYLAAGVPVGEHLADQLLLPLALAGGGSFATFPLSLHATTQIDLLRELLNVEITVEPQEEGRRCRVWVGRR